MSPCAGLKRCPLQHTAHKNLHEVSLLTGGSGSQTVSTLLLHCEMQQTCSAPTPERKKKKKKNTDHFAYLATDVLVIEKNTGNRKSLKIKKNSLVFNPLKNMLF